MTRTHLYWLIALAITLATVIGSAVAYQYLPDRVPTHWNMKGEIDGWGSKNVGVLLLPATIVGFLGFFWLLPWLSPKDFKIEPFKTTYEFIMVTVIGLFSYMQAVTLYASWQAVHHQKSPDIGRLLFGGIFLFLALIGNVMGKVRRNFWVGVRVPWTLASERVWNDTHRLAAWTMVGGSLLGFLLLIVGLPIMVPLVVLIVSTFIPVVYSFVHYKNLERRGELDTETSGPMTEAKA